MLSFAGSFRAVARRQACKVPAVRAMASASAQTATVDENPYSEISDYIHDIAEEQKTIAAGSTGEIVEGGDAVPEPRPSPIGAKGFPTLTGFRTNQFVRPQDFTRDTYAKMGGRSSFTKRALLGPGASKSRYLDIFHQMNIDPLQESQNSKIMSRFVTSMGKIKGRSETNLTWQNQRRVGKAIRRAKMMGIIPVLSRRTLLHEGKR
ncbi:uncharacterized protein TRAVEDRAFT_163825 [Trametes versicolor FP-101664 SS1]|uniref:uncharacterized protein n=1 Tax=Trametes versicolor (strain FP-101664) TaxID=717944 RepID=UPI00046226AC|nr:uncharacterized protein TRAVEDRAFT_163825 [Trametes versicolor FP-101664 SS1]EIW62071.1 hypothetical protein TRAVEDRAFT_163825 [Trametes versicolor FP-101664 SS1]